MHRVLLVLVPLLAVFAAVASTTDPRGWSDGTPAANAARWLSPLPDGPHRVELPASVTDALARPTLLVYFAPTCPHCQHAAPELAALARRLGDRGDVLGIATGGSSEEDIAAFVSDYDIPFRVVHDTDSAIASAMGARSTPSALLVDKQEGGEVHVIDAWYPYQRGHDTLVELRLSEQPFDAFRPGEYHGTAACASCHVQEADGWLLTHHSVAWKSLVAQDKHTDDSCNGCHVTGKGEPTGWDGDERSILVDVGCEACHGPGGPHDGERTDPRSTCEGCHDAEHSIHFSYDKGLPLIDHYQGTALDAEAFRERRKALWDGEAPRALLAFDEGPFVGAAACKDCHADQHAHWKGSPHGNAMATLAKEGADDPSCVRCHASPKASGLPPSELSGFLVEESVSCESCHGPGGEHVAAGGGTDNIVGLGESCPVCVIEAVCTSCHTPKWDPDWDLERDLERIGH